MKIACIGNMNNIMFQLMRYFTDEKHDVTLFLLDEHDHFSPQADSFDLIEKYNIIDLGWNFDEFIKISRDKIKATFEGFDFYIGTDIAPALMYKAGMYLDVFIPHGSDLYDYPFAKYRNFPAQNWEIPKFVTGIFQRRGIAEASSISADMGDEVIEKPIRLIRHRKRQRIISPPILYLKQYGDNYEKKSSFYEKIQKIRKKFNFIVFQHSSQDWSNRGAHKINKGNDVLIKAFANYLKHNNYVSDSVLVLLEYGQDLNKSKELIEKLKIESNVIWLPKMYRKDILASISVSDICVGELGERYWYCYSCIFEFMAMKKPLIHHRNDEHYKNLNMELYPMVDASSTGEVENVFIDYRKHPDKYIIMGEDVYLWLHKRTEQCLQVYRDKMLKKQSEKVLSNKLSMFPVKQLLLAFNPQLIYSQLLLKMYSLRAKWQVIK